MSLKFIILVGEVVVGSVTMETLPGFPGDRRAHHKVNN